MKKTFAPAALAVCLLLAPASPFRAIQNGTRQKPAKADLKPGEYTWDPHTTDTVNTDAFDLVVSLGEFQPGTTLVLTDKASDAVKPNDKDED